MASKPPCPYCDSEEVREMAGDFGLWKCLECDERFEVEEHDDTPDRVRTKFKSQRYGEEAW